MSLSNLTDETTNCITIEETRIDDNQELIDQIKIKERTSLLLKQSLKKRKKVTTFNFGKCRVCKDRATGIHYGIQSCEGCKGFFKRSLPKYKTYVCFNQNQCNIDHEKRKSCKYCRFKLCLESGMSLDSIKMGRIPNSEKFRLSSDNDGSVSSSQSNESISSPEPSEQQEVEELDEIQNLNIDSISEDQLSTELILYRMKKIFDSENSSLVSHQQSLSSETLSKILYSHPFLNSITDNNLIVLTLLRDRCYQLYMDYLKISDKIFNDCTKRMYQNTTNLSTEYGWRLVYQMIVQHSKEITKFAEELPGFSNLYVSDFKAALNSRMCCLDGIRMNKYFTNEDCYMDLGENTRLDKKLFIRLLGEPLTAKILKYHSLLTKLNLTNQETALMLPLVLSAPDIKALNSKSFQDLNDYYLRAFMFEIKLNNRDEEFRNTLLQVLLLDSKIMKIFVPKVTEKMRQIESS